MLVTPTPRAITQAEEKDEHEEEQEEDDEEEDPSEEDPMSQLSLTCYEVKR